MYAALSAESYVDIATVLDVSNWRERGRCCIHVVLGDVSSVLQLKPDPTGLPFTGKTEQLLLIVFGYYNIILRREYAYFVGNTTKSRFYMMFCSRLGNMDITKCNFDQIPLLIQREYLRDDYWCFYVVLR